MKLHPVVESILTTKRVLLPDGQFLNASSHIPRDECELIYRQIRNCGATDAVEVGMAFGISSVCLCDALSENAKRNGKTPRLIGMDPAQHDETWQGAGLSNIKTAGFEHVLEFYENTSQDQLPQLVREHRKVQFAFIDGWHTFDHTLVDFFYVDQLLLPGGIVVLDDVGYPSVNAVVRFILSNRSYELVEALQDPGQVPTSTARHTAKKLLARLSRTNRTPSPEHSAKFALVEYSHAVALQKTDDDRRRWDHFSAF